MAFRLPKLSFNRDWLVLGGSAILVLASAIQLRNNWPGIVPSIPGVFYGQGPAATGFETGSGPYKPVPGVDPLYQQYVRPTTGPIGADIQQEAHKLALWGGAQGAGQIGRGLSRDNWSEVYDASKDSSTLTGDNPAARLTLA